MRIEATLRLCRYVVEGLCAYWSGPNAMWVRREGTVCVLKRHKVPSGNPRARAPTTLNRARTRARAIECRRRARRRSRPRSSPWRARAR